jgi:hypothetical protein
MRYVYEVWSINLGSRDPLENLGVYRRIILQWISKKNIVGLRTEFVWLRTRASGALL